VFETENVRGGNGQKFSNSCGCKADLNFADAERERTKNYKPLRALVYAKPFDVTLF